jgi:hypothetical protein
MGVTTDRLTVREAARELGLDGAELYRMVLAGEVAGHPNDPDAEVYITRTEVERIRAALPR